MIALICAAPVLTALATEAVLSNYLVWRRAGLIGNIAFDFFKAKSCPSPCFRHFRHFLKFDGKLG